MTGTQLALNSFKGCIELNWIFYTCYILNHAIVLAVTVGQPNYEDLETQNGVNSGSGRSPGGIPGLSRLFEQLIHIDMLIGSSGESSRSFSSTRSGTQVTWAGIYSSIFVFISNLGNLMVGVPFMCLSLVLCLTSVVLGHCH